MTRYSYYYRLLPWVLAGIALGILASTVLHAVWMNLPWKHSLAEWLREYSGGPNLAAIWGMVWIRLPEWVIATVVSISAGLLMKNQPVVPLLSFGISFVVAPLLVEFVADFDFTAFASFVSVQSLRWNSLTIAFALIPGLPTFSLKSKCNPNSASVSENDIPPA